MYIHTVRDIDADPHTCACRLNCHLSAHRWGWRKFYTFSFRGRNLSGCYTMPFPFEFCCILLKWLGETNRPGLALICDFNAPPLIQAKPSPLIAVKCWRLPLNPCPKPKVSFPLVSGLWQRRRSTGEPLSRTRVGITAVWFWGSGVLRCL